jgi:tetratricopeptide (TPR) repeat protein
MARRILIASLAWLLALVATAQQDLLLEALRAYQDGRLEQARELVDKAVKDPAHAEDPEAWLLRGFILKDVHKATPAGRQADLLRDEALGSLITCMEHDPERTFRDNAMQAYDFLARTFFNDAARALNEMDAGRGIGLYGKYREAVLRVDPKADLRQRDIEFHNALGTVYTKRFSQDRQATDLFEKAVEAYRTVLGMDPENYGANYNMATLYYNRGVYKIQRLSSEDDIPTIQQVQEVSKEFFLQALPYMKKAHDMDPKRRETLLGLEGIYYSLQDPDSSDHYRRLFEELGPLE